MASQNTENRERMPYKCVLNDIAVLPKSNDFPRAGAIECDFTENSPFQMPYFADKYVIAYEILCYNPHSESVRSATLFNIYTAKEN